jgi:hypothetical protein
MFARKIEKMDTAKLKTQATLNLPVGLLLIVWDLLANRLSETPYKTEFSEEEKRAIWALEDLCENELVRKGFEGRPKEDWDKLIQEATEFVKTIPGEFLD